MTRAARDYSDADLVAYLDGAAPEELCREIEAALVQDAALGQRLADMHVPMDALKAGFDALLDTAPAPVPLKPPTPRQRSRAGLWAGGAFATGLAAGLAIAVFAGLGAAPPAPTGWKAAVASYQALYAPETVAALSGPVDAQAQLVRASDALGLDLSGLPDAEGFDFRRAQILQFRGKTLIQIAFAGPDGAPFALCILPANSADAKDMQTEVLEGLAAASWNEAGFAYLLIGGDDPVTLQPGAQTFEAWSRGT